MRLFYSKGFFTLLNHFFKMMDRDYYDYGNPIGIRSTAGAVPVMNEKGEITMQKVKVTRYVTGKRPLYAPDDEESSDEETTQPQQGGVQDEEEDEVVESTPAVDVDFTTIVEDKRLRRLQETRQAASGDDSAPRHVREPEVIEYETRAMSPSASEGDSADEDEEADIDEDEIELRRQAMRERVIAQKEEADLLDIEEEAEEKASIKDEEEEESSEYEEYSDSEDEMGPRLKPVFVRKEDRVTIQEKESQEATKEQQELLNKQRVEERKKDSIRLVAEVVAKELERANVTENQSDELNTDDENEEEEYEAWKVRELKRIKRTREERETTEREKMELERMHNMTEEERRAELRNNPRIVTNKQAKGKYKFLQKYYHRGVFYLDAEDDVYRRDFAQPTLEDHFNKTVLPKVMQVKNFGRSGRTKYTHLVDQDTTDYDSSWAQPSQAAVNFQNKFGGGLKQVFVKPTAKKRKIE